MLTLQIPPDAKTLEMSNSIVWFEDDILYSKPTNRDYVVTSREEMAEEVIKMREFVGNRKVLMIAETHPQAESPKQEDRDYISDELHNLISALAIITPNAVSRMVANLFFLFKPPSFPTKMFINVSDAKEWLKATQKKGRGRTLMLS
jgi:hypothetical protein